MPGRDGTGPMGLGEMSGRGLGLCSGIHMKRCGSGVGRGFRQGYGRNFISSNPDSTSDKELLAQQKVLLENRLDSISKKLEKL